MSVLSNDTGIPENGGQQGMPSPALAKGPRQGVLVGFGCYILWGLLPLFWALLAQVSPLEILAHRVVWAFVFLALVSLVSCRAELFSLFRQRRALVLLGATGLIVTFNWGLYIFAVNNGHILQASLGYYINPLFNILLGVAFFKERLTLAQKIATVLAAVGVLYFTFDYGSFPWVALCLAASFALYGLLKKYGAYPAVPAMALETTLVAPLALLFVAATFLVPSLAEGRAFLDLSGIAGVAGLTPASLGDTVLLMIGGVLTALPLILFAHAANSIPFSVLGFIQYLSPTLSFLLGVFVFGEDFTLAHAVCFGLIWLGLLLVIVETFVSRRRTRRYIVL